MHELSISSAIVDTALRHADGRPVRRVDVTVGALRQVVGESLAFYFEIVARDTDCEGAEFGLQTVSAWMRCRSCDHEWDPAPQPQFGHAGPELSLPAFRCPACERPDAEVVRGDELEVESIEVETAEEEQCIAPR